MAAITFANDVASALKGIDTLLVVAPAGAFRKGRLPRLGDRKLTDQVLEVARDLKPGDLGAVAATITATDKPRRLVVGALPDDVARYNCPARAESVRHVVAAAKIDGKAAGIALLLDDPAHLLPAANAVGRALPLFSRKTGAGAAAAGRTRIKVLGLTRGGKPVAADRRVKETVAVARQAARLVDAPPTEMHPGALAAEARALLKDLPRVKIKEIRGDALLRARLGGVHAVGRTAVEAPRVLIASYAPAGGARAGDAVALVGKGVTYDTGGLHVKARGAMESMKGDMGGAAAVLGAFRVLVADRHRGRLHLVLCLAENAIGPTSYKPDDILEMHSGKTVEINNTDAEGRLLLADGASYAARVLGAGTILEAATLTGAQMIATGSLHAAVVSNDAELESQLCAAGQASGDLVHPLPFAPEFYQQEFRSPVADMRNSVKNRMNAQSSCAAQFVWSHIADTGVRWGHVDMAGPSWRSDRGTGYGVALLAETVRRL